MKIFLKSTLLLIHYWFPVLVGWSIILVIHRATGFPISPEGELLYMLAIWAAYSLDRLLDRSGVLRPHWLTAALWVGLFSAASLGAVLFFSQSLQTMSVMILFAFITFVYHKAKKFPLLKTLLVAILWTWAGMALPFQNAWQFWTVQTSLPLVILLAANAIMCDFKDLKSDELAGVRSLPAMLGLHNTTRIASFLLVVAALISYEQGRIGLVVSSVALIGLAQFPLLLSLDAVGPLLADAALTLPGFLILLHWV